MRALHAAAALLLALVPVGAAAAQEPAAEPTPGSTIDASTEPGAGVETESETTVARTPAAPADAAEPGGVQVSTAVEIALLLTVLSVLPALVITVTSFTRIVIVLSFVRRSLSVNELPPNPVLIALSLFLTTFVMGPVFTRAYETAYVPYREGALGTEQAAGRAWGELRGFLVANTRTSEIDLFLELGKLQKPVDDGGALVEEELPFRVVVPAFVLSELKTSFQMGFLLFLPFLVIDLVVASVLISMGMFMLPPVMISTPFKVLLFVLVDGWHLVCQSLVTSFVDA
jgi:flagellar biosynthetic protein FliP